MVSQTVGRDPLGGVTALFLGREEQFCLMVLFCLYRNRQAIRDFQFFSEVSSIRRITIDLTEFIQMLACKKLLLN